jgi:hypothetical protein
MRGDEHFLYKSVRFVNGLVVPFCRSKGRFLFFLPARIAPVSLAHQNGSKMEAFLIPKGGASWFHRWVKNLAQNGVIMGK